MSDTEKVNQRDPKVNPAIDDLFRKRGWPGRDNFSQEYLVVRRTKRMVYLQWQIGAYKGCTTGKWIKSFIYWARNAEIVKPAQPGTALPEHGRDGLV